MMEVTGCADAVVGSMRLGSANHAPRGGRRIAQCLRDAHVERHERAIVADDHWLANATPPWQVRRMDLLMVTGLFAIYFALQLWILPRLGVRT